MHAISPPVHSARRCPLRRIAEAAGFTLLELLVVVAVIAILLAISLPALSAARRSAERARELLALRSLSGAWNQYALDSAGILLPGYKSGLPAFDANHDAIAAQTIGVAANRWVWRLAPYLGHEIGELFVGDHARVLAALERTDQSNYLYQSSVYPSFGLNSVWIGGDENFGGFNSAFESTFGRFYATRLGEIARPAETLVFASARSTGDATGEGLDGEVEGYFRVRSPRYTQRVWSATYLEGDPNSFGNLSARHSREVAVGFADGHSETRTPESLDDMRLWSPSATAPDWQLTPGGG